MNNKMMTTMVAMKTVSIATAMPMMAPVLSPLEVPGGSIATTSPVVIGGVTPVLVGLFTVMEKEISVLGMSYPLFKIKRVSIKTLNLPNSFFSLTPFFT